MEHKDFKQVGQENKMLKNAKFLKGNDESKSSSSHDDDDKIIIIEEDENTNELEKMNEEEDLDETIKIQDLEAGKFKIDYDIGMESFFTWIRGIAALGIGLIIVSLLPSRHHGAFPFLPNTKLFILLVVLFVLSAYLKSRTAIFYIIDSMRMELQYHLQFFNFTKKRLKAKFSDCLAITLDSRIFHHGKRTTESNNWIVILTKTGKKIRLSGKNEYSFQLYQEKALEISKIMNIPFIKGKRNYSPVVVKNNGYPRVEFIRPRNFRWVVKWMMVLGLGLLIFGWIKYIKNP